MIEDEERGLYRRLREAGASELASLVAELGDSLDRRGALAVLRNPHVDGDLIEEVASRSRLAARYELQREIAGHGRTPRALALRFVPLLYWRDLVALSTDTRLHPIVRRSADRRLLERLPALAVGEKIALARRASPALLAALRFDPSPRVIAALLENPRLTEGQLVPLAAFERANPRCLEALARDRRWSHRVPLRTALCRNPATPLACALSLLPALPRGELSAIANDPRLATTLRRRAEELSGAPSRQRGRVRLV